MAANRMIDRPSWKCPKCSRSFTRSGQSRSCGSFSVARFLEGGPAEAELLYRKFEELVTGVGVVVVAPAKTRIGFQNRRIFAAVNRARKNHLDVHFVTSSLIHSQRIRRVEQLSPECSVSRLRLKDEQDLYDELTEWVRRGVGWGGSQD